MKLLTYISIFIIFIDVVLLSTDPLDDIGHSSCARPVILFILTMWFWTWTLETFARQNVKFHETIMQGGGMTISECKRRSESAASRWGTFASISTIGYSVLHFGSRALFEDDALKVHEHVDGWHGFSLFLFVQVVVCACLIAVVSASVNRYRCKIPLLRDMSTIVFGFWRVCFAPLLPVKFFDVLLGDWLTSFAKVFGDVTICLCVMIATSEEEESLVATSSCIVSLLTPFAVSLPFMWRFLQCIRCYVDTAKFSHIANAFKYCTGILVVFASTNKRTGGSSVLFWASVMTNSLYSFYWDVVMDWGIFSSLSSSLSTTSTPTIIRDNRRYNRIWYIVAVIVDFFLRISWSMKLSASYGLIFDGEYVGISFSLLSLSHLINLHIKIGTHLFCLKCWNCFAGLCGHVFELSTRTFVQSKQVVIKLYIRIRLPLQMAIKVMMFKTFDTLLFLLHCISESHISHHYYVHCIFYIACLLYTPITQHAIYHIINQQENSSYE